MLDKIKKLPKAPGVYQFFDKHRRLLYVGKAKNLSSRVKSYFVFSPSLRANPNLSIRILKMIKQSFYLEYIVVKTEHDALILENSLIKQLKPKYNILLRDDKTYPYIYIDYSKTYPRFEITRKIIKGKGIKYFGPYSSGAREILNAVYDLTKLVQKKGSLKGKKLCLYYQINKCLGVCQKNIPAQMYQDELSKALEFIKNKKKLIEALKEKMIFYAENMRFEDAALIRDAIEKISKSQIHSDIDFASGENYDIFVAYRLQNRCVVVRIFMRDGKIISSSHDFLHVDNGFDVDEVYKQLVLSFYKHEKPPIIANILVGEKFDSQDALQEHLSTLFGKKITIKKPLRGRKKELVDLAFLNAKELLLKNKHSCNDDILEDLRQLLKLDCMPHRIEIFDNSHMFGSGSVGAMVVYENGAFQKNDYRKYHLEAKDEYLQMKEVLTRRVDSFKKNPPPDLWVLDGGDTLLKLAKDILNLSGVFLDVIAISKEKIDAKAHRAKGSAQDIIYTLDSIFRLKPTDKRLQFLQNLRDEAHRCAINFHKKTKLKQDNYSKLLSLNGISQAKIKKLLNYFGTFETIKSANFEEISAILSKKDANIIKKLYN